MTTADRRRRIGEPALRGAGAGLIGVACVTLVEKAEQRVDRLIPPTSEVRAAPTSR